MDVFVDVLAFIRIDTREEKNPFLPRHLLCGDILPAAAAAIFWL